uniref:Uncharacterized protein n=1 Tax=Arundo donax TaxID=35708 RepID=A0A0A9E6X8_ARUDO
MELAALSSKGITLMAIMVPLNSLQQGQNDFKIRRLMMRSLCWSLHLDHLFNLKRPILSFS